MKRKTNSSEDMNFWVSYSDLMAGVLIIFILLLIFKMYDMQKNKEVQMEEYEKLRQEVKLKENELLKTKKKVQELSNTRLKIIELLQNEFEKANIQILIDPNTGAITLKEGILFDTAKSDVKNNGKEFLGKFIPLYLKILLGNEEIRGELAEIIIEGHTDDINTYLFNLNLSQKRSYSVVEYLMSDEFDYEYKDLLKNYITANGKSFSQLKYKDSNNTIVDREESRRVEFKFRLKEEETLLRITKQLEQVEYED